MALALASAMACSTPEPRVGDEHLAALRDGMNPAGVDEVLGDATRHWLTQSFTLVSDRPALPGRTLGWYVWTTESGLVIHGTTGCRTVQLDFGEDGKLDLASPRTTVVDEVLMAAPPGATDEKRVVLSKAEVFDPKKELQPLAWPEDYDEQHRDSVEELVDAVAAGGSEGSRAKSELDEMGHGALVGLINELRDLDYFDSRDTMLAYELNGMLVDAVGGVVNPPVRMVAIGDDVPLDTAHWNARIVLAWQRFWSHHESRAEFETFLRKARSELAGLTNRR